MRLTPMPPLGVGYTSKCFLVVRCVKSGTPLNLEGIGYDVTGFVP